MNILLTPGDYFDHLAPLYSFVRPLQPGCIASDIEPEQVVREIQATNNIETRRTMLGLVVDG